MLDMSDILADEDFLQEVTVLRRTETLSGGRNTIAETSIPIQAVICAGSQPLLERPPEGEYAPNTISVHTQTRLIGPRDGYQPDVIQYGGNNYIVTRTYDYSAYGGGFVRADCDLTDMTGSAP